MSVQTQINSLIQATNLESLRNALVQTLTNLNETIVSGGVQSVEGELVDNTDPANPVVNLPYKSVVCLLNQTGTANPTGAVLQNDFTGASITFGRDTTGIFKIISSLDPTFTEDKTVILATSGGSTYNDCFIVAYRVDNSVIVFNNYGNGGGLQDEFTNLSIEIRVYP